MEHSREADYDHGGYDSHDQTQLEASVDGVNGFLHPLPRGFDMSLEALNGNFPVTFSHLNQDQLQSLMFANFHAQPVNGHGPIMSATRTDHSISTSNRALLELDTETFQSQFYNNYINIDTQDDNMSDACNSACCDSPCTASQCAGSVNGDWCEEQDCAQAVSPCTDPDCIRGSMNPGEEAAVQALARYAVESVAPPASVSLSGSDQVSPAITFPLPQARLALGSTPQYDLNSGTSGSPQNDPGLAEWVGHVTPDEGYSLYKHIITQHNPQVESQCVEPCMLSNYHFPDDACPLPRDFFVDAAPASPGPGLSCGVPLPNIAAFVDHFSQEHMLNTTSVGRSQCPEKLGFHYQDLQRLHIRETRPTDPLPEPSTQTTPDNRRGSSASFSTTPIDRSSEAETPGTTASQESVIVGVKNQFECNWHDENICNKKFAHGKDLHEHVLEVHIKGIVRPRSDNGYWCKWATCDRTESFKQRSKLERHIQTHTEFKPHYCERCDKYFSAAQALAQHIRTHTGEAPFPCTWEGCTMKFKQQSARTMHMRTHTGEKPLQCSICGKRFSESSNLSKHVKTHNERGNYFCRYCGKNFRRNDQMRRHLQTVHEAEHGKPKSGIDTGFSHDEEHGQHGSDMSGGLLHKTKEMAGVKKA